MLWGRIPSRILALSWLLLAASPGFSAEPVQMARGPALSPDGNTIVFAWAGDIWSVSSRGGVAVALTTHEGGDRDPRYSIDGSTIGFVSNRSGRDQIYEMPASGGAPRQITRHSEGYRLLEYAPDGKHVLVQAARDHFWRDSTRMFLVSRETGAEELLFDAHGDSGRLSPNGRRLLFTREGTSWFRKGYRGSQASQIWSYDRESGNYTKLLHDDQGFRYPLWKPDGSGFYYVGQQSGCFNLWEYTLVGARRRQLTSFDDDAVLAPALSRDGKTIVFRRLADLYRYDVQTERTQRLTITNDGEPRRKDTTRLSLTTADNAAFSSDGLEIAFTAAGDIWVMDTELREPQRVTATPEEEREPVFSADGKSLIYLSDAGGEADIWRARRGDEDKYWWQNQSFVTEQLTNDAAVESRLELSPDGKWFSFVRGNGNLVLRSADFSQERTVLEGWDAPWYSWSPDAKWLAYSVDDNDFNSDVWIVPIDGSRAPFNLSRHPDNDSGPVWSPDGRLIAFTGRRSDKEVDIYYAWLRLEDADEGSRDRKLEKALEKMKKGRAKKGDKGGAKKKSAANGANGTNGAEAAAAKGDDPKANDAATKDKKRDKGDPKLPEVVIDFDGLEDRLRRISIADSRERGLFWIEDQKLAFSASVNGSSAIYSVKFPDELRPKKFTSTSGSGIYPMPKAKKVGWRVSGVPAALDRKGKSTSYSFQVRVERDEAAHRRSAFDLCWRAMRDNFYDPRLGNRDWEAVRTKYRELAAAAVDGGAFGEVVNLMLGELNGSHLSFRASGGSYSVSQPWSDLVGHLGVSFDRGFAGPGWKITHVFKGGPAAEKSSRLQVGDVILSVDGTDVDRTTDMTAVLLGPMARDVALRVKPVADAAGESAAVRDVTIRPTTYGRVRRLHYEKWIEDNRRRVDEGSNGTLGYLHIRGMNWPSFLRFEAELYKIGVGKDGLVIDVRMNGGGSTTDHLLTALTQPRHAITVPRGGGTGYPQDRRVYASWDRPIIVLCDQHSFSNAEIFSHAIKSLGRGQLVGVTTAGGVISTGGRRILDAGFLRMPFRGWYLLNGEDMELFGAAPDHEVWAAPGTLMTGTDAQLDKAISELLADVARWRAQPQPPLRKSSQRPGGPVKIRRAKF